MSSVSSTPIRKILIATYGDPSVVSIVDDTIPSPPTDHAQVKVIYSGMSGADQQMRQGTYPMQKKAPLTPGYCVVGRIVSNGPSASKFYPGDMVACLSVYDGQSTLVNLPEKYLIRVPDGVDLQQAEALVLDWNTAYGMVHRQAKVTKGQRVFIHGLSGAVGFALLKLCLLQGAECYGTASESNHPRLREEGAKPFVYSNKDWIMAMNSIGGAHAVFDPLGYESWDESWQIMAPRSEGGGHLVGYGGNLNMLNDEKPRSQIPSVTKLLARNLVPGCPNKTSFYYIGRDQKTFEPELKELFKLQLEGKIDVPIKKVVTLDEVPETHKIWTKLGGIGSVIVKVNEEDKA
ncbi:chaperonin 10-like protein [Lophiotrema nucula]|uniref:Chaperonin 10-like protein n=1 Tax=Lophiotrema nucula TaxID=690887 RepID=A0A6A5YPE1_9PLEO|nr:chaperonin 10-like protein [Lophiotrema nucula]